MIEAVDDKNLHEILPLIRQYQAFYQVPVIDDDKNARFFSQFSEQSERGCQFLYRENGVPVAFATVYFTFSSTLAEKVGLMNDLFTTPECRGKGIGKMLIDHCLQYSLQKGAIRLQWLTATSNAKAQRLYDSLSASKSEWFFYAYKGQL